MSLKFVAAPPPRKSTNAHRDRDARAWVSEAEQLKQNPNKWAMIADKETVESAGALAYGIRHGSLKAFNDPNFDAVTRGTEVWATYKDV